MQTENIKGLHWRWIFIIFSFYTVVSACAFYVFKTPLDTALAAVFTLMVSLIARLIKPNSSRDCVKILKNLSDMLAVALVYSSFVSISGLAVTHPGAIVAVVLSICLLASLVLYRELLT